MLGNNWSNFIPSAEKIIFRQCMYKVYPVLIQPWQSTAKCQRLYNVGCTTGLTFFRLWKKKFSVSECTRSIQRLFNPGSRLQNTNVCTNLGVQQSQLSCDFGKNNFPRVDSQPNRKFRTYARIYNGRSTAPVMASQCWLTSAGIVRAIIEAQHYASRQCRKTSSGMAALA